MKKIYSNFKFSLFILITFQLLLGFKLTFAQNLHTSSNYSYYTFVYKITDQQAKQIFQKKNPKFTPDFFTNKVDSFITGETYTNSLSTGHYIQVFAKDANIDIKYTSVNNYEIKLINNGLDFIVELYDSVGNIITDAKLKIGIKKVKFDTKIKGYKISKANTKGVLSIDYKDFIGYNLISRRNFNPLVFRVSNKVLLHTPIKYIWRPVYTVVSFPFRLLSQGYYIKFPLISKLLHYLDMMNEISRTQSYMIFSKPKYKPQDTVKLKALIVKYNKKPYNKEFNVYLNGGNKRILLGTVKPYSSGAYTFQFVLSDSLDLMLDKTYSLVLETKQKNHRDFSNSFEYEDYELKSMNLKVKADQKTHFIGKNLYIDVNGKDENDINLQDANIEILIVPALYRSGEQTCTFVPDTLYHKTLPLEPRGVTHLVLQDSLFPKIDFVYRMSVKLRNSNNERKDTMFTIERLCNDDMIHIELNKDSIMFAYKRNGNIQKTEANIVAYENMDKPVYQKTVNLPYTEKLNPYYQFYFVNTNRKEQTVDIKEELPLFSCAYELTNDSLYITISNPRNINFTYHLYNQKKEILSGNGTSFVYNRKSKKNKKYTLLIDYIWAGEVKREEISISNNTKQLNIESNIPSLVYPGQTINCTLKVTDYQNNPVSDVNLTAYGITKKFGYKSPKYYMYDNSHNRRPFINSFSIVETNKNHNTRLNYDFWKSKLRLDTSEYFKFIYPKKSIYYYKYVADSITQFAPFIFKNGIQENIQVIYVDNVPAFFNVRNHVMPYSFRITPGLHQIKIRTNNKLYVLENIYFQQSMKTIFSLSDSIDLYKKFKINQKRYITDYEFKNLKKYLFVYENSFGENYVYLRQNNNVILLNSSKANSNYLNPHYSTIPIFSTNANLVVLGEYSTVFPFEPNYKYLFTPNYLKIKSYELKKYEFYNYGTTSIKSIHDKVLTEKHLLSMWNKKEINPIKIPYYLPLVTQKNEAKIKVYYSEIRNNNKRVILVLLNKDKPEIIRICPGSDDYFHGFVPGNYKIVLMLDSGYVVYDSIQLKSGGTNVLSFPIKPIQAPDKLYFDIEDKIKSFIDANAKKIGSTNVIEAKDQGRVYYNLNCGEHGRIVTGKVEEDLGPMFGVAVGIPGTTCAVLTDIDGRFNIFVPNNVFELEFKMLGYEKQIVSIPYNNIIHTTLINVAKELNESIVVGYGERKSVGLFDARMQGRTLGMYKSKNRNHSTGSIIQIRGVSSIENSATPLYVIDGEVNTVGMSNLDPNNIENIEILKGGDATSIYGRRGANRVVIITTKGKTTKGKTNTNDKGASFDTEFMYSLRNAKSTRNRFSDDCFWQPQLTTNNKGIVSFNITFPDDITNWVSYAIGYKHTQQQSGYSVFNTKSMKPYAAQLAIPRFLVLGDTVNAIGKALNFTMDTINIKATYELNDKSIFSKSYKVVDVQIDTLNIIVTDQDSIKLSYAMLKTDGYKDEEVRTIPIYKQGVELSEGNFYALNSDTTIHIHSDADNTILYADSRIVDVFEKQIYLMMDYVWECNEQLASKLKILISYEKICKANNKIFTKSLQINSIISKLKANQNDEGLWGWWGKSETSFWVSKHVGEALREAEKNGHKVFGSNQQFVDKMIYILKSNISDYSKIELLQFLKNGNAQINYTELIKTIKDSGQLNLCYKLKLYRLMQDCSMKYPKDSVLKHRKTTLFGNVYFGYNYNWYSIEDNVSEATHLAYQIIENDSTWDKQDLQKIFNYYVEYLPNFNNLNTYQKANIAEQIIPFLLKSKNETTSTKLYISGTIDTTVSAFPYKIKLNNQQKITIKKEGVFPCYLSVYKTIWQNFPQNDSTYFRIQTHFEKGDFILKAGEREKLIVEVQVKKTSNYVMIEIPIPAGCSYESKNQNSFFCTHTEFYKNKVVLFCTQLKPGDYKFSIDLLPKYTGIYVLNPAKIELMYFPTFKANNSIQKVRIF